MKMGLSTVTCKGLQPPTLKLHKKFTHGDKNLISTEDLALIPKEIPPQLYTGIPKIRLLHMIKCVSSTLTEPQRIK